jgi:hypothetical protein
MIISSFVSVARENKTKQKNKNKNLPPKKNRKKDKKNRAHGPEHAGCSTRKQKSDCLFSRVEHERGHFVVVNSVNGVAFARHSRLNLVFAVESVVLARQAGAISTRVDRLRGANLLTSNVTNVTNKQRNVRK